GLAQNESPQAGKLLFDRFKKKRLKTMASTFLNLLYIKIPLYDPDRLLVWMLPKLRWIFTGWFLALSVGIMMTALGLVLMQWDSFLAKLPSAQQFFRLQTLMYAWVALGAVKIIH